MPVSLATWNINSVRLRLPLVLDFLAKYQPDVLCLQEIKCLNDQFPRKDFAAAGYPHTAVHGQKGYHGVATISRLPLHELTDRRDYCGVGDARHLSVVFEKSARTTVSFSVSGAGRREDKEYQ